MGACQGCQFSVPYVSKPAEQTQTSLYARIGAVAFGAIAVALGVMALAHVPAISAIGVAGGAAFAAAGGLLLLGALLIKCVRQGEIDSAGENQPHSMINFVDPEYRADGNYDGDVRTRINLDHILKGEDPQVADVVTELRDVYETEDLEARFKEIFGEQKLGLFFDITLTDDGSSLTEDSKGEITEALKILLMPAEQSCSGVGLKPGANKSLSARLLLLPEAKSLFPDFYEDLEQNIRLAALGGGLAWWSNRTEHFEIELVKFRLRQANFTQRQWEDFLDESVRACDGKYGDEMTLFAWYAHGSSILDWDKVSDCVLIHQLRPDKGTGDIASWSAGEINRLLPRLERMEKSSYWEPLCSLADRQLKTMDWNLLPKNERDEVFSFVVKAIFKSTKSADKSARLACVPEAFQSWVEHCLKKKKRKKKSPVDSL